MGIDHRNLRITVTVGMVVAVAVTAGLAWWLAYDTPTPPADPGEETTADWRQNITEAEPNSPEDRVRSEPPRRQSDERQFRTDEPAEIERRTNREQRESRRRVMPGQQNAEEGERLEYDPAVLRVVTNFEKADVTVNGLPYPEYKSNDEDEPGIVLPAGGPYNVQVTYNGKKKTYTISLQPYKVRYLMVDLSGFKGGAPAPSPESGQGGGSSNSNQNDNQNGKGKVTVYSKPKGQIRVDGNAKEQQTPGTVEVDPGQHNIQVKFESGQMSESKTVRVRKGSRIKLFFRKND